MDKHAVRDRILHIGIVPVVRASSSAEARTAAEAVCKGGIPIVEITMTVPGAVEVIRELAKLVLDGAAIDSERFKEIIETLKTKVRLRSRELFHPIRLALAGRAGEGELDRVILLLDSAAALEFVVRVKGTRERMLEFCAALD